MAKIPTNNGGLPNVNGDTEEEDDNIQALLFRRPTLLCLETWGNIIIG